MRDRDHDPDESAQSSGEELGLKSLPYLIISDYQTKSCCLSDDVIVRSCVGLDDYTVLDYQVSVQ